MFLLHFWEPLLQNKVKNQKEVQKSLAAILNTSQPEGFWWVLLYAGKGTSQTTAAAGDLQGPRRLRIHHPQPPAPWISHPFQPAPSEEADDHLVCSSNDTTIWRPPRSFATCRIPDQTVWKPPMSSAVHWATEPTVWWPSRRSATARATDQQLVCCYEDPTVWMPPMGATAATSVHASRKTSHSEGFTWCLLQWETQAYHQSKDTRGRIKTDIPSTANTRDKWIARSKHRAISNRNQ